MVTMEMSPLDLYKQEVQCQTQTETIVTIEVYSQTQTETMVTMKMSTLDLYKQEVQCQTEQVTIEVLAVHLNKQQVHFQTHMGVASNTNERICFQTHQEKTGTNHNEYLYKHNLILKIRL